VNLEKERAALAAIQQEVDRLADDVRVKKSSVLKNEQLTNFLATPAGLAEASDTEIETAFKSHRAALRELGLAEAALRDYEKGAAADLASRFRNLERREEQLTLAARQTEFETALALHIERWLVIRTSEIELEKLALAAKQPAFARIVNSVRKGRDAEKTAFDGFCDDICGRGLARLLPPDNPRRVLHECLNRTRTPAEIQQETDRIAAEEKRIHGGDWWLKLPPPGGPNFRQIVPLRPGSEPYPKDF
jgi:hypothetical protein